MRERGGVSSTALLLRERLSGKGTPTRTSESIPVVVGRDKALIELYSRSIQAADLPHGKRVDIYWEAIENSVDDVALGVGFLIRQLPLATTTQATPQRDSTRRAVREILRDRIPGLSNGLTKNDKFELEFNLLAILTYLQVEGQCEVPREARHYLSSTVQRRPEEEQLLMIVTASNYERNAKPQLSNEQTAMLTALASLYTREMNGNGRGHINGREKAALSATVEARPKGALTAGEFADEKKKNHQRLQEIVNGFANRAIEGVVFDGKMLRLAGILLTANEKLLALDRRGIAVPLRDLAVTYIINFYNHFRDAAPAQAINTIAKGLEDQPLAIKRIISALLVDKQITYEDPKFGGTITRNLSPLLRNLLAHIGENPTPQETDALIGLMDGLSYQTFLESGEKYAGNLLVAEACRLDDAYTTAEKILLVQWHLRSLVRYGFVIDVDSLSEDEIIRHGKGEWFLRFNLAEDGQAEDGTDITNHRTGKVVGHYENPTRPRRTRNHNGHKVKADSREGMVDVSTNGHIPEAREEIVVFQEPSALPDKSAVFEPEPLLPKEPTEGEKTEELLKKIFKTVSVDELRAKTKSLWSDLDPYGPDCKRRSTIAREGTPLKLDLVHRVRAEADHYPRVVIARREEKDEDGIFSSDIGGVFYFSENLIYPFFLDRGGGLQGPLADLFLQEEISDETYEELNYVAVSSAHSLAVADKKRLGLLAKEAYMQVKKETEGGTPGLRKKREASQEASEERIARLVDESKQYVKTRERAGTGGHLITESYIDAELVEADLASGEMKRVYRWLTLDEMKERVKKARKGKAKPNAENGRAVPLPYGKNALGIAIQNAIDNNIRLFAVEVFSHDLSEPIPLGSTFSAYPQ